MLTLSKDVKFRERVSKDGVGGGEGTHTIPKNTEEKRS